jgi:hypothetical protein
VTEDGGIESEGTAEAARAMTRQGLGGERVVMRRRNVKIAEGGAGGNEGVGGDGHEWFGEDGAGGKSPGGSRDMDGVSILLEGSEASRRFRLYLRRLNFIIEINVSWEKKKSYEKCQLVRGSHFSLGRAGHSRDSSLLGPGRWFSWSNRHSFLFSPTVCLPKS